MMRLSPLLVAIAVSACAMRTGSLQASGSQGIGFRAGQDMASRLWSNKYQRECWQSDRFFSELQQSRAALSASAYHAGYRQGLQMIEDRVATSCHETSQQGQPLGECPQTGYQHGDQLGAQICNGALQSFRTRSTCAQQALSSCFTGLQSYVQLHCQQKLFTTTYRQAERECQQTFARM